MLKGTKSTSMNFNSMINDKSAVYMSAQIPVNGSASITITVTCTRQTRHSAEKTLKHLTS